MGNVNVVRNIVLTGERLEEFTKARDILASLGMTDDELSNQRVLSASLQVLIGAHEVGGELSFKWVDGRLKNGNARSRG